MTLPRTHFGIADRGASEVINADLSEYFNTIHGIMTFAKPYKRRFPKRRRLVWKRRAGSQVAITNHSQSQAQGDSKRRWSAAHCRYAQRHGAV